MQLNEKILRFASALNLQIVEDIGKSGKKYYKVLTYLDVEVGRIDVDCSYEEFLEHVVANAVHKVDEAQLC
jgi:hypothetical protein